MNIVPLAGRYGHGKFTLVDDDDLDWALATRWPYQRRAACRSKLRSHLVTRPGTGYAGGRGSTLHRAILTRAGHDLTGLIVDHHNGWGLDNRKINLRQGTPALNARNTYRRNINKYADGWRLMLGHHVIGVYPSQQAAEDELERVASDYGFVTAKQRAALLKPVIDFLDSLVTTGVLKRHIQNAPLIEDRYRLILKPKT